MAFFEEKPHVLVVDDDDRIRTLLTKFLTKEGYIVVSAGDAFEAEAVLQSYIFDLLIVDVMMPGRTGFEFIQILRETKDTPVILLTAKGEVDDKIEGLTIGADDYVTKPFEPKELVLRINAILKRAQKFKKKDTKDVKIGHWMYNRNDGLLSDEHSREIQMTDSEQVLMAYMIENANNTVSRYDLAEKMGLEDNERGIDVQITRLRKKLEDDSRSPRILKTVRGKGYLLQVDDV